MAWSISSGRAPSAKAALGLLLVSAVLGLQPARAEPPQRAPAARRTAQAWLTEGVGLLQSGEYAGALTKFEQAYALVPSPNIHYDLGLAYVGLGRDVDALAAFDAFLASATRAPAGKRAKAEHNRETLRARLAALDIASDVDGAEVTVDGRAHGTTPLAGPVYVSAGPHEVAARKADTGAVAAARIEATPGERRALALHLVAQPAATPPAIGPMASGAPAGVAVPALTSPVAAAPAAHATAVRLEPGIPPPDSHWHARTWALATAGAGVALLGVGALFGLLARREGDSLTQDSMNGTPPHSPVPFDPSKESNGLAFQTLEAISLAAGAAAVAAGLALYAIDRHPGSGAGTDVAPPVPAPVSLTAAPVVAPACLGARLEMSF